MKAQRIKQHHITASFLTIFLTYLSGFSYAQEPKSKIFGEWINMRSKLERHDQMEQLLQSSHATVDVDLSENLNIDVNDIPIYKSLKNPFQSKLPLPEKPENDNSMTTLPPSVEAQAPTEGVAAPTAPLEPRLNIKGLVWETAHPQAIVNSRVVGIGDTIDDWQIIDISREGIKVKKNNYLYFIKQ